MNLIVNDIKKSSNCTKIYTKSTIRDIVWKIFSCYKRYTETK